MDTSGCLASGFAACTIASVPYTGKLAGGVCASGKLERTNDDNAGTGTKAQILAGDRVDGLVAVRSGRPRWFTGRVERVNEDGTLHMCYDDGDEELSKDRGQVRPSQRKIARGSGASSAQHLAGRQEELKAVTLVSSAKQGGHPQGWFQEEDSC